MIISLGIDLVDLERIERIWSRFGLKFARRILSETELARLPQEPVQYLASRFAAKEAASKALGTGFSAGISPRMIEVENLDSGRPTMRLFGPADLRAQALGTARVHVSLTHSRQQACCLVILEN